jgi:hypothetical protein
MITGLLGFTEAATKTVSLRDSVASTKLQEKDRPRWKAAPVFFCCLAAMLLGHAGGLITVIYDEYARFSRGWSYAGTREIVGRCFAGIGPAGHLQPFLGWMGAGCRIRLWR